MRYIPRIIIISITILFLSCKESPLCFRTGADYFPLKVGNISNYSVTPTNKEIVVRITDSVKVIANRESFVLERNGTPEYWWRTINRVEKLYLHTINIEGTEDTLAEWWMPWLELPFSINNSWSCAFNTSKILMGDTINLSVQTNAKVVELKGEEYKIKINFIEEQHSAKLGSYSHNKTYYEWYKPNLGMTRREFNDTTEVMTKFISEKDTLLTLP